MALGATHRIAATKLTDRVLGLARLLPREPPSARAYAVVVFDGGVFLPRLGGWVETPAILLAESRAALTEDEGVVHVGGRTLALHLERTCLRVPRGVEVHPLGPVAAAVAQDFHGALGRECAFDDFVAVHARLFDMLAAEGLLIGPAPVLVRPLERDEAFACALGRVLSVEGERPALVDFAEGTEFSARTARRRFGEIAARHGWGYTRWQTFRRQWSLVLSCFMLTLPEVTAEDVRRVVGFGPTSLHHALLRAGLPAPRELKHLAAEVLASLPPR